MICPPGPKKESPIKNLLLLCALTIACAPIASAREYFVRQSDPNASDTADGSSDHPLRTINAAAQLAQPGDTVTVGPGVYREWISPARGGTANAPIVYRSVPEHAAIVRGTDVLDGLWQDMPDAPGVFTAPLPQKAFIFGNPFVRSSVPPKQNLEWIRKCNALVFLNDQPLLQVTTREELARTPASWFSSDDGQQVFIHLKNDTASAPVPGTLEITTRDRIFVPHRRGLGYITVDGFIFERCASRPGFPHLAAVDTQAGNHWIIKSNIVRQTTGIGIDAGSQTWRPELLRDLDPHDKHIIISRENLVQGNLLADNAQCAIVAWNTESTRIVANVVRNNAARGAEKPINFLADAEAAGIKVHAFRHGLIEANLVENNSSFGIWLDNGWENARVTRNVAIHNRGSGIFVEFGFGPCLVDHNLCAQNIPLWLPYLGDGIYTHDASGVTIAHNTLLDNARFGVQAIVVAERSYANRRLCEASDNTITGNLFANNALAAIAMPLDSPRSRYNHSDYNAFDSAQSFLINNNEDRIPMTTVWKSCRELLHAARIPDDQLPDMSDPSRLPVLPLQSWRVVMQMDSNSTVLPPNFRMHFDPSQNRLTTDLPTTSAIPTVPPSPGDDFDLIGQPIEPKAARAGAIQNPISSNHTVHVWPLTAVARTAH